MASNSFSQPQLYKCGLCLEYILFENIYLHNCVQNFTQVFITEDNVTFFPQTAVEERPPLWNYKDCLPKDRTNAAKNKLWEEIEEILNPNKENPQYTAAYFKNKWRNLLDTYRVYLSKERTQSGQAAHKKKPWRFMDQMGFIKESIDLEQSTIFQEPCHTVLPVIIQIQKVIMILTMYMKNVQKIQILIISKK
ncbi:uncharacterized protein LOC118647728 isoform X3 [Monomorium pharaonis]|uniref:uncharacterized protein LOC118647728 isoform X3 n=1 Tax=Monomorium pharaonis TaxID=307658 RepID=UPI0017465A0E|nr:uncharacterized protein LOC118647728 isoform X3 [Monomorium pharaonis]